jgi:hypothetical protein
MTRTGDHDTLSSMSLSRKLLLSFSRFTRSLRLGMPRSCISI